MEFFGCTSDELAGWLQAHAGRGPFHARAAYQAVFRHGQVDIGSLAAFRRVPELAATVRHQAGDMPLVLVGEERSGQVRKAILALRDGYRIEMVNIAMPRHATLCLSTQAGCRMGCRFCRTGMAGFHRNLAAAEIVAQLWLARFRLGWQVDNVVLLGMGEPLDNYEAVVQALRVMADQQGFALGPRRMTLSTIGLDAGIRRLAAEPEVHPHLAVSLHAADEALRRQLLPVAGSVSLEQLRQAMQAYLRRRKEIVFLEYVLIRGVNDAQAQARQLIDYVAGLPVRVNIIACNPAPGSGFAAPRDEAVRRFCGWLAAAGVFVRQRTARGGDIAAACGQLGGAP